jgi:hypothetical protein
MRGDWSRSSKKKPKRNSILAIMEEALALPLRTHLQLQKQTLGRYTEQLTHLSSIFCLNKFPGQFQSYGKVPADILEAKAEINRTNSYAS